MNERIKELLRQAYDEAVPETWTTLSSLQQGRVYEKFAELIVRECVSIVDGMADPEVNSDRYIWAIENASHEIKKHFGIKGWVYADETKISEDVPCKTHPDAPHGFDRNMSHTLDRYVCECEHWEPSECWKPADNETNAVKGLYKDDYDTGR